jgi:hypothetical protein
VKNVRMRSKLLSAAVAAAAVAGVLAAGVASAGTRAETTVTITVQGRDFSGTVDSPRPLRCAKDRKIILYKQVGTVQDPTVDKKIASDIASLSSGKYRWGTGNTGIRGRFYARAPGTPECKADSSPTIHTTS